MPKLEWEKYPEDRLQPVWLELTARQVLHTPNRTAGWFTASILASTQEPAYGARKPWHLHASLESRKLVNKKYDTLENAIQAAQTALDQEWESMREVYKKRGETENQSKTTAKIKVPRTKRTKTEVEIIVDELMATQNAPTPRINNQAPEVAGPDFETGMDEYLDLARQVLGLEDSQQDNPQAMSDALEERWGISTPDWRDLVDTLLDWTKPLQDPKSGEQVHAFGKADPETARDWTPVIAYPTRPERKDL